MIHVMIKHKVKDFGAWKTAFDNFAGTRKSSGEQSYRVLHPTNDANDLTLIFGWDSTRNAEAFLASPELKSAMGRAGVVEEPQVVFMHEVAQGTL
jgi:quinol monooxygenase YgiN